jgi:hypothetical protein
VTNPDGLMRSVTINNMRASGISLLELWMNPNFSAEIGKNYKGPI